MTATLVRGPNPEQLAAIEADGLVFVSAGAGTGKTTVLVERFVRALERGVDVGSILVITYTERAAGELRSRIRSRLVEIGRRDAARELDGAWVSTIHGFCLRLLRAHPLAAGLDPRFRVLDDSQARVLQAEAFDEALAAFCREADPERLDLLATYGSKGLRGMLLGVAETLRAAGRPLELVLGDEPDLDRRVEELRRAARSVLAETEGDAALEAHRWQAARALELVEGQPPADRLLDLSVVAVKGRAKERFAAYEQARAALEQTALNVVAVRDRDLLQELLVRFDQAYTAAKDRESGLDFEDLQLKARDLLRSHEDIRVAESLRFRAVMVDEFQDTNRLQCELVDLLAPEDLFFVGDEFQSIYRFRHADVDVFKERRAASGGVLPLTKNYRSRPELLAVVNELFASDFGEDFQALEAAGRFPDPAAGPAVELVVTDKAAVATSGVHWRRAEARAVARRVQELVETGEAEPGEIVLLFAAGTDAELFEEELRALGLPTYRAAGRGYFGQQQVVDLLAYLRLVHNRYDDEALVTVLASPLIGVSNDALVLLRRAAGRRPLFCGLEHGPPAGLSPEDDRLVRAFRQRYERLTALSARLGLERLLEQIVCEHDYDLAVLAQWDGRRRYANLRKLGRLARSYEELRGPDIEGFVRFVRDLDAVGAREGEAFAEEEAGDAVRLLTVHAAKGLEFRVVVVADAGRDRPPPRSEEILCLPDGRFGFKVVDPTSGKRRPAFDYDSVKAAEEAAGEAERRRLYYVAMTRAIDRLIVSGSIDPDRPEGARTPIGWVLERLGGVTLPEDGEPVEIQRGEARLVLRVNRSGGADRPQAPRPAEEASAQLRLFAPEAPAEAGAAAPQLPPLPPLPEPPLHEPKRLSYSALALFARCPYRYYAERVAGMRPLGERGGAAGPAGLAASEVGEAVHALLEAVDPADPRVPEGRELAAAVRGRYPAATDEEVGRIGALAAAYARSALARRVAALPEVRSERPFAFEHDGVLLHGRLDLFHMADGRALVVDFKTNVLGGAAPAEVIDREYRVQRLVYALAALRAGAREVEVVYQFLERPDDPVATVFSAADTPTLEAELSAEMARIREGRFVPTPSEMACAGCPVLDVVCAGPRLLARSG
ncbi:MAG TPA: UvrD-helicase domain-containing protein [Gaiellaceae bacterium]|nr:UvrD-helicase domain-containing protein [Gaiellaceae bacterium]